jgi:hypothetical protein
MSALPDAGLVLIVLLRVSPLTAIAGSLLEIDLLRAPPLYALVPAASETPYTYPTYAQALLAPAALLAFAMLLPILRRR